MEVDKLNCERGDVHDNKEKDDAEICIKAKDNLPLQEQLVVGGELELDITLKMMLLMMSQHLIFRHKGN